MSVTIAERNNAATTPNKLEKRLAQLFPIKQAITVPSNANAIVFLGRIFAFLDGNSFDSVFFKTIKLQTALKVKLKDSAPKYANSFKAEVNNPINSNIPPAPIK